MTFTTIRDKLRLFLVALGVCCLLVAGVSGVGELRFEKAVGIVEMNEFIERGQRVMRPTISYTRHDSSRFDGTRWGYTPSLDELPRHYKTGDSVTILYDSEGKTARIASVRFWAFPIGAGVIGVTLVLLGLLVVRGSSSHDIHNPLRPHVA